ncbi:hypothetical protein [hymenopteran rhabdo-related virus 38]|uniref:Uncharacterized protein n=1 Tax=hymenopteran rhabdo-related virus 38 TaxID=2847806 RepID=A0A7D7FDJ2_9RHAB|nr:hypothetical protein QKO62_gp2 [hymenopteran rhabdo-related virus 38]QMP82236.1 hypothetical protein [hymenopteran rhabdo-related virus 38]
MSDTSGEYEDQGTDTELDQQTEQKSQKEDQSPEPSDQENESEEEAEDNEDLEQVVQRVARNASLSAETPLSALMPQGISGLSLLDPQEMGADTELVDPYNLPKEVVAHGKASKAPPEKTKGPEIPKWYPYKGYTSEAGLQTAEYLEYLRFVTRRGSDTVHYFLQAKGFVSHLKCSLSSELWVEIMKLSPFLLKFNMIDAVRDLSKFMINSPESAGVYLQAISRCTPHCTTTVASFEQLENRIVQLENRILKMSDGVQYHIDEATKLGYQFTIASKEAASFKATIEEILMRFNKFDFESGGDCPPEKQYSLPSSSSYPKGNNVRLLDFSIDGEYTGPYNIKVVSGEIASIEPPPSCPQVAYMASTKGKAREIFFNLDQYRLINVLSSNPELRNQITEDKTPARKHAILQWTRDVKTVEFQWSKVA